MRVCFTEEHDVVIDEFQTYDNDGEIERKKKFAA
jgi:hypothetical protein